MEIMSLDFGPGDSDAAILFMGCMIGFSDVYNVWHDAKTAELTDITSVYTSVRLSIAITIGFIAFSRSIILPVFSWGADSRLFLSWLHAEPEKHV